jgi:hypothetical protein
MFRKRREEPKEPVTTTGLSYTETFVRKITDLLKQDLAADTYETTFKVIAELCHDDYDLNRAGAAAIALAEKQKPDSQLFRLYSKLAGDLFRKQCESERTSGRTTIFTGFYNSAIDAYLEGGYGTESIAVAFEHSHWLMVNALYKEEAGKQKYLDLSVKAFDEVLKRSEGKLAVFLYEQQQNRKKVADALVSVQPPAHLINVKNRESLETSVQTYRDLIAFLDEPCKTYDIAAYLSKELAAVLEKVMPDRASEYAALAEEFRQRHGALLSEEGIS